jgi:phytoene dehydrogenase-like protein
VILTSGEQIEARAVVTSLDPRRTFLEMLDPALLDPDDLRRVRGYRIAGTAAKVNLALDALPSFRGLGGPDGAASLRGRIHIGPDIDYLERAFDDSKYGRLSARPHVEITIPSLSDPSLAPPGRHVVSAYAQYAPYRLAGDWRTMRQELADRVIDLLEEHAPGLRSMVVGRQVLTPVDLEEVYGLTGGHPYHGEHSLDQLLVARPLLGWSRYRAPLPGLYLCGASTHPGGGVTGGPGANAAREVLRDLRGRA